MNNIILEKAKEVGIDIIGFTNNSSFHREREIIEARMKEGCISPFFKIDLDKNTNPIRVWEDVKSIISVGVSYNNSTQFRSTEENSGKISKAAWGRDYHQVLMDKMQKLMRQLQRIYPDLIYKAYVDIAPLLDRAIAVRSGIGFYGKNGFVINPKYGSYVFLGHILINKTLKNSPKVHSFCGICNKCIDACPTGALQGDKQFNPNRCISYITQKKGILSRWERRAIGTNLYGCDICQEVCPINKRATKTTHSEFKSEEFVVRPKLFDMVNINNEDYNKYYKMTSAGWRGKKILQRNAIIVAGNVQTPENFKLLMKCTTDARWDIRLYSMLSLLEYGEEGRYIVSDIITSENTGFMEKYYEAL